MNVFAICIFVGQAYGSVAMGWIGQNLGIQWCYGVQGLLATLSIVLNVVVLRETRGDVLLRWRAKKLSEETGKKHVCVADLDRRGFVDLVKVSIIRPLRRLLSTLVFLSFLLLMTFLDADIVDDRIPRYRANRHCPFDLDLFRMGMHLPLRNIHSSRVLPIRLQLWATRICSCVGLIVLRYNGICQLIVALTKYSVVGIGGIIGFISNFHQEHLYHKAAARSPNHRAPPEVRLYWAATGGLMFPIAMFIFAWTGRPSVHWAVPAVILIFSNWGIYCMYAGVL